MTREWNNHVHLKTEIWIHPKCECVQMSQIPPLAAEGDLPKPVSRLYNINMLK